MKYIWHLICDEVRSKIFWAVVGLIYTYFKSKFKRWVDKNTPAVLVIVSFIMLSLDNAGWIKLSSNSKLIYLGILVTCIALSLRKDNKTTKQVTSQPYQQ